MTALYALAAEYRATALQLADLDLDAQTVADTLEGISDGLMSKAENVGMMVRSIEADASAIKQWAKDAADRAKAMESRADQLRAYMTRCLEDAGIEKVEAPGIRISWRKSTAVAIDDAALIPAEYMQQKPPPEPEPDKTKIGDALKAGKDVPGAKLDHRRSLQIK